MSGTLKIKNEILIRKRRDGQVYQTLAVTSSGGNGSGSDIGNLLGVFEIVNPGEADEYLRVKLPLASDGEIQAFTDSGQMPTDVWLGMPTASTTVKGGVKVDGTTIVIADGVISSTGIAYAFQHSLSNTDGTVNLTGDTASPGNNKMYGTNGSGTRGWYDVPSSMVYPGSGIPLSTGSSWGASIANNSGNWNTAYGWGNHASAGYAPLASPAFSGNVGIGGVSSSKLTIFGSHTDVRFQMHSTGGGIASQEADLFLWASEPGATYQGVGIANNRYNGNSSFPIANGARGGSYIRLMQDEIYFAGSGGVAVIMSGSGNISAGGEITAYSSSDRYLKQNIRQFSALDKIEKTNPVAFNWNSTAMALNSSKDDRINYGLIAQDLEQIMPELVHSIYDKYKSVDYVQMVPVLLQAIKELRVEIRQIKGI